MVKEAKLDQSRKCYCGELWFEGELCILFAERQLGKSILAVQIGQRDKRKVCPCLLKFTLEAEKQKVVYFDFELSEKQFETR